MLDIKQFIVENETKKERNKQTNERTNKQTNKQTKRLGDGSIIDINHKTVGYKCVD
jgi:hypothetical protein